MKMSFWSHCQNLIFRLQQSRTAPRPRLQRRPSWRAESLEARTLLSSAPAIVADINPGAGTSNATNLVAIGSTTYFTADDGVHGLELWKSDGTAAGTLMVTDINPGDVSSNPGNLINVNGTLFFTADDGVHGNELWKSDGTVSGTTLVKDINSTLLFFTNGTYGSQIGELTNVNGTLFFYAYDGFGDSGLWKSDGSAAGTVRVSGVGGSELTNVKGTLFFTHDDGIHGRELWKSDGTEAGTTLVKDIFPGATYYYLGAPPGVYIPNSSNPADLTNVNGTLFFTAYDNTAGRELWKSDGTEAGTTLVNDIFPGTTTYYGYYDYGPPTTLPHSSSPNNLTNVNGTLFFSANDGVHGNELWKTDGTGDGTVMVGDLNPSIASSFSGPSSFFSGNFTNVDGALFFMPYNSAVGWELWTSDGTAAGTMMVKDIAPGIGSSVPSDLTNVNGTLFFQATDVTHGYELWQSDGTAAGTTMVMDILPGSNSSNSWGLTNLNGTLLFTADDGVHGTELWALNATSVPSPSLVLSGFPVTTTAGSAGSFTVALKNADGTTNTGYLGKVHFTSTDPQAVLPPDYTFTAADHGTHTFSATLKTAGSRSISATDTQASGLAGAESNIQVKPAAASTMFVGGFPSPNTAGVARNLVVTLKDAYGNIATGYTGKVHFTSTDARAVLPANYTFTAADAGTHTFSATLKTAGTRSITAADTLASALKATEGGITVIPAAASKFLIAAPANIAAGAQFNLTVTVEDAYSNIVTGYTGTVHFTSTDNRATLPANYTFKAADNGVRTFTSLVLRKKGKQTITITDTLNKSVTGTVAENVH